MQRFYQRDENRCKSYLELNRQTAFHEAGHVAAICLENQRKNLPLIHFELSISKRDNPAEPLFAKVTGGRLVEDLATVVHENAIDPGDSSCNDEFQLAYEADIINFLAGPLAEAKYIAIRDNEIINSRLLTPKALHHYGGSSDMQEVMSYLEFFISSPAQRQAKLNALFTQTFSFIDEPNHWKGITALANYILNNANENLSCEQALEVLAASGKK